MPKQWTLEMARPMSPKEEEKEKDGYLDRGAGIWCDL
jgi:hypothetical protein